MGRYVVDKPAGFIHDVLMAGELVEALLGDAVGVQFHILVILVGAALWLHHF